MRARAAWLAAALALAPPPSQAQDLASRVGAIREGTVRMSYALREGAEVCDRGIRLGEHSIRWRRGPSQGACSADAVTVELSVREGSVRDVEVLDLGDAGAPGATDLGAVPAQDAAAYLLSLARGGTARAPAAEAVFAAALADVADLWRSLLEIARDDAIERDVRASALFWIGQDAAEAATAGLAGVAADEQEDQEVREAAVFALSQRSPDESVPLLIEIARSAREPETRRAAMFWLAQADDARVLAFFEEILLGGPGR